MFSPRPSAGFLPRALRAIFVALCVYSCAASIYLGFLSRNADFDRSVGPLLIPVILAIALYVAGDFLARGRLILTPVLCLLIALTVWHLSFAVVYYLGLASPYRLSLLYGKAPEANVRGLSLAVIGIASFLLGIHAAELVKIRPTSIVRRPHYWDLTLPWLQLGGVALIWGYFFLSGRSTIGDYSTVFAESQPYRKLYNFGLMLCLGTLGPLVLLTTKRWILWFAVLSGLLFAIPPLLMGVRWVFFTVLVVLISAWSVRGWRIPLVRVIFVGIVLVAASAVVKEVRFGGSTDLASSRVYVFERSVSFLTEFFEETGMALISCIVTADLHDNYNVRLHGRSYLAASETIVPGLGVSSREDTPDALVAEYFEKKYEGYSIGYSIIAEWYLNFGIVGVFLGQALLGVGITMIWRHAAIGKELWLLISYVVLAFLLFGFRNDMFTWVRPLTRAFFLILALYFLSYMYRGPAASVNRHA